jgi:hypothetical protein
MLCRVPDGCLPAACRAEREIWQIRVTRQIAYGNAGGHCNVHSKLVVRRRQSIPDQGIPKAHFDCTNRLPEFNVQVDLSNTQEEGSECSG